MRMRWISAALLAGALATGAAGCSRAVPSLVSSTQPTPGMSATSPDVRAGTSPGSSPEATRDLRCFDDGRVHEAGPYRLDEGDTQTIPLTVTMTEGWSGCGLAFKELGPPAGLMMVGFWDGRNVYRNPCHWRDSRPDPGVGPSVADLATALVDQELTVSEPADPVTIDGYDGLHVRLEVPPALDTTGCDADPATPSTAEFRFMDGPGDSVWWLGAVDAPGLIGQLWILDVDGRRVVIQTAAFVDAGEARQDELAGIVSSIEFAR